jgi:hypothetical protein
MPDPGSFLPALLVALMVAVLLWFAFGTQRNIGRGNRLLTWLSDGLPLLGPRTTLRWLGSSVAEMRISQPRHPYREALIMVVLEPRDLGALWALSRSRGRRDFMVFRLSLIRAPAFAVDVIDPAAWTATDRRSDDVPPEERSSWTDAAGRTIEVHHDGQADLAILRSIWDRLGRNSGGAWRISVRPTVPHLEIHLLLPAFDGASSRGLLTDVRELAASVSAR